MFTIASGPPKSSPSPWAQGSALDVHTRQQQQLHQHGHVTGQHDVVQPNNGIYSAIKRSECDSAAPRMSLGNTVQSDRSQTENAFMKCPEQAKPWGWSTDGRLPGAPLGRRMICTECINATGLATLDGSFYVITFTAVKEENTLLKNKSQRNSSPTRTRGLCEWPGPPLPGPGTRGPGVGP